MLSILGHKVDITSEKICQNSGADHILLKHEARADRMEKKFDVLESHVLCLKCGKAIPLNL